MKQYSSLAQKENTERDALKYEEEKSEDNEMRSKQNGERLKDKDEIAFFERLNKRLENKGHDNPKLQSTNNVGHDALRRLSLAIPNLINRQNTLLVQKRFLSKQNSIIKRLSRKNSLKPLPKTVRGDDMVNKIENKKKEDERQETDEEKRLEKKAKLADKKLKEDLANLEKFLDSTVIIVIMSLATIFVLFADDVKTLALPISSDFGMDVTKTICFALFLIEVILSSIAKKGYVLSFFFWLDLISTLSLIQDIGFMINPLIYGTSIAA